MTQRPMKLLDQVRDAIRLKHYAYSTEKTYVYWAKRSVLYHSKRHPLEIHSTIRPWPSSCYSELTSRLA